MHWKNKNKHSTLYNPYLRNENLRLYFYPLIAVADSTDDLKDARTINPTHSPTTSNYQPKGPPQLLKSVRFINMITIRYKILTFSSVGPFFKEGGGGTENFDQKLKFLGFFQLRWPLKSMKSMKFKHVQCSFFLWLNLSAWFMLDHQIYYWTLKRMIL